MAETQIDPFAAECLVSAIGVEPFLAGTLRKVHRYQVERAIATPADIDRRILRFLGRAEPEETADLPDFDFDAVAAMLAEEPTEAQHVQVMSAFEDPEMALACTTVVKRIADHLRPRVPRRVIPSLAGPELAEPPRSDVARFARLWAVANDPVGILNDLNEFALSADQVAGAAAMYPEIYARMGEGVDGQLTRIKASRQRYRLLRQKESLLRKLKQMPPLSTAVGPELQAMYAASAQAAAKPVPAPKKKAAAPGDADISATPAQRAEAK